MTGSSIQHLFYSASFFISLLKSIYNVLPRSRHRLAYGAESWWYSVRRGNMLAARHRLLCTLLDYHHMSLLPMLLNLLRRKIYDATNALSTTSILVTILETCLQPRCSMARYLWPECLSFWRLNNRTQETCSVESDRPRLYRYLPVSRHQW
jgi:hypothetical protein